MEFKVGDRVIIKAFKHQRSHGYATNGEVITSNYRYDGTYQIRWDIPEGHKHSLGSDNHLETYGVDKRTTTWVHCDSIELDIQYVRENKLKQIGI